MEQVCSSIAPMPQIEILSKWQCLFCNGIGFVIVSYRPPQRSLIGVYSPGQKLPKIHFGEAGALVPAAQRTEKKWRLAYLLSELFKFVRKSVMLRTWCGSRATFIEQDADSIFQLHRCNKTCFEKRRDVMFPLQKDDWFGVTLSFDYKFQMACDLWEEHHWWIGAAT